MKLKLPYPHPGQQEIRRQAKRHNWLSAGRRWRKTTLLTAIVIEACLREKGEYVWGAPTFDQVRIAFEEARRSANAVADFNQSRMTMTLPTGGVCYFRSLDDPDNARGYTANGVVIDESGDVKPIAWYEVLRPMLIDTGGWSWGIGTPKGRNWFFVEHMNALSRDDSMSWQVPTVGCEIVDGKLIRKPHPLENPFVPFVEIERLYETMPERTFKQEILAEFIEGQGSVFRNITACLNAPATTPEAHAEHMLVGGVDWAQSQDFTTVSIGCRDCKVEVARERFNQIDYFVQRDRIKSLYNKWKPVSLLCELNSIGQPNFEMLQRDGLPVVGFMTTASSKAPLIENLALALERTEWQFQADPVWTAELEAYERTVSKTTGRSSYNAPSGAHDDTVISRALMVWQANQPAADQLIDFA